MKQHPLKVLLPGVFTAAALALAVGLGAQTPPTPTPAAKAPQAAPAPGHHKDKAMEAKHEADLKAECQAMMVKKQEMQDKFQAMDAKLDKLVDEMNAAQGSKAVDAMEKPMAAVLNELVVQRKAMLSMMTEMQPAMMAHMMHHIHLQGTKGAMECPLMKTDKTPKAEEKMPKM